MCGRFTLRLDRAGLQEAFPWLAIPEAELRPRYNVAPSQPVAVVPNDGRKALDYFVWGLIPFWADDPKIGYRMINARGETLHEKPSFRAAYRRRRCLVLSDGFYEWKKEKVAGREVKTPYFIRLKSDQPFAFAGLWEIWHSPLGDEVRSCTIITTRPNELLRSLHNRMPVILPPAVYDDWLDPAERDPVSLAALITPFPAEEMEAYPVSTLVNTPSNDLPECILPA